MRTHLTKALSACLAVYATGAAAQTQQQVKPPIAVYWMSVETAAGMGVAMPPGMGAMLPPGMAGGKRVRLDLGSAQSAAGEPQAQHAIPAGMGMGASLPLVTPVEQRVERAPERDDEPEYQKPKGRVLIYWGCGEQVRPGQPVVLDFATMNPQEAARVFRSVAVARGRASAPGRNRTYGAWPNANSGQPVPAGASLLGEHVVSGNYSPEIRFPVGERDDFMAPVAFDPVSKTPAGAFGVQWKAVPTATGYFASAIGQGENRDDVVMWSSSEKQVMGQTLMDYLPPAEVERLVRDKVVLAPQTTACAVPAGAFKGDGAMLQFIAYGDELNLVHPPRPKDPKQVWEQQWAVKLRLKSTGMTLLAEGDAGARRGRAPAQRSEDSTQSAQPAQPQPPSPADAVQEGVKALRGILRF